MVRVKHPVRSADLTHARTRARAHTRALLHWPQLILIHIRARYKFTPNLPLMEGKKSPALVYKSDQGCAHVSIVPLSCSLARARTHTERLVRQTGTLLTRLKQLRLKTQPVAVPLRGGATRFEGGQRGCRSTCSSSKATPTEVKATACRYHWGKRNKGYIPD